MKLADLAATTAFYAIFALAGFAIGGFLLGLAVRYLGV